MSLRHRLPQAHAGIEARRHDVDQAAVGREVERHAGEAVEEGRHDRAEQVTGSGLAAVDPQRAADRRSSTRDFAERLVEAAEHGLQPPQEPLTGLGRRHAPCRAVEKANAEIALEPNDGVAQRRSRQAERVGRLPEAAVAGDRGEGRQVGKAWLRHW